MKLYFVRQAVQSGNQEGRFQGASGDSPFFLNPLNLKKLGQYLNEILLINLFKIYLERSNLLKLSKVNSRRLVSIKRFQLREWQLGKLEGLHPILEAIYPTNQGFPS